MILIFLGDGLTGSFLANPYAGITFLVLVILLIILLITTVIICCVCIGRYEYVPVTITYIIIIK